MKVLKSKFHNSRWKSFKVKMEFEVKVMPIVDLWGSVPIVEVLYDKPFKKNLKNDIEKNGLVNPLLAVNVTKSELVKRKEKHKTNLNDLPFDPDTTDLSETMYVVWGGTQRLNIAKELEYTHIDCAMIPTLDLAQKLQSEMRRDYKQLLYSRTKKK